MLVDVVERLLGDTVEGELDLRREALLALDRHVDRKVRAPAKHLTQLTQKVAQLGLNDGRRAQLEQQGAHLRQSAAGEGAHILESLHASLGVFGPEAGQHLGNEARREEGLGDGVVQLASQALALLEGGALLSLLVEPGVLHGHRCLVGDGAHEADLVSHCRNPARRAAVRGTDRAAPEHERDTIARSGTGGACRLGMVGDQLAGDAREEPVVGEIVGNDGSPLPSFCQRSTSRGFVQAQAVRGDLRDGIAHQPASLTSRSSSRPGGSLPSERP